MEITLRLAIANDTHFNHCNNAIEAIKTFVQRLNSADVDALLFTGDISDGSHWSKCLLDIRQDWDKDIYFVLGNHDSYLWSWDDAYSTANELMKHKCQIVWLDNAEDNFVKIDKTTAMVGSSAPACLTAGINPLESSMWERISDFHVISELMKRQKTPEKMISFQRCESADMAKNLSWNIKIAQDDSDIKRIIIATHVAPFVFSAKWCGKETEEALKPFYISKFLGRVIEDAAKYRPDLEYICVHGHTHGHFRGRHPDLDNVVVMAGEATYCQPKFQMVLETSLPFCGMHTA